MTTGNNDFTAEFNELCQGFQPQGELPNYPVNVISDLGKFTFTPAHFRHVNPGVVDMIDAKLSAWVEEEPEMEDTLTPEKLAELARMCENAAEEALNDMQEAVEDVLRRET